MKRTSLNPTANPFASIFSQKLTKLVSENRKKCLTLFIALVGICAVSMAQTTGDYRTTASATNFNLAAGWEVYNGGWIAATYAPGGNSLSVKQTASWSSGANTITLAASNSLIRAGQYITVVTGIPAGTTVASVSGTTVTLSQNTNAAGSSVSLTFSESFTVTACTTATGSNAVTLGSANPAIAVGMAVSGSVTSSVPAGTTVASIVDATHITLSANSGASSSGANTLTFSTLQTTASFTSGASTITLNSANSLVTVGMSIYVTGVPAGAKVTSVSGTSIGVSIPITSTSTGVGVVFGYLNIPNMYVNHSVNLGTNTRQSTIGNVYVNNSSGIYSAGAGAAYTNATLSIGDASTNAEDLTCGTINIASGATLNTASYTSAKVNTIELNGGDNVSNPCLNNNGTLDLTTTTGTNATTTITFATPTSTYAINTGGGTYKFNNITLNMGGSLSNVLEIKSVFSMATAVTSQTLTITSGTFNITTASNITPWGSSAATITASASAGLIINNASAVINAVASAGAAVGGTNVYASNGTFTFTSGTVGMGANSGLIQFQTNGTFTLNGGTMTVYGAFNNNGTGPATISSGTLTIPANGAMNQASMAIFKSGGSALTLSGGNIYIYSHNSYGTGYYDWYVTSTTNTYTGGNVTFGAAAAFQTNGAANFYNLAVGDGTNSSALTSGNTITVKGNLNINTGSTLTVGTNAVNVAGNWINNGTYTTGANTTTFNGTTAISGSSANSFSALTVAASSSLTAPAANMNISGAFTQSGTFYHYNGTVTFNGSGGQTIPAANYYNLTVGGTKNATLTATGNTINGKNYVDFGISADLSGVANGMIMSGTGFTTSPTANSKAAAVTGVSATLTASSSTVTCTTTGLYSGMVVTVASGCTGFPTGTVTIASVTSTNITLSASAAASVTSGTLNFGATVFTSANATSTATNSSFTFVSTLTFQSSGTIAVGGALTFPYTGTLGTLTTTGSTVNFNNTTGGQTIPALPISASYVNLTMGNTSGTQTAGANLSATTLTTTAGGTLDLTSAYTLGGTLSTITNNGTIKTAVPTATSATPIPTGKTWGGTIEYAAASGSQTVVSGTYNNLTISNTSGVNTSGGAITANGTTTINSGATLAVGATLTTNGAVNVNGTFQLNSGGYATGGTWTYGAAGTLAFNNTTGSYGVNSGDVFWPSSNGPVNVTVSGAGGLTMNVARSVSGTFTTAATVTNANDLTLNGTTQLNSGGYFASSPTYGVSSTLVYNTTYGTSNEWTGGALSSVAAGSGIPANVTVQTGTLTLSGGRGIPGNLTVNSGTGLVLNATAGDLYLGGNLTNNGSTWTNNGRAVFFVGSGTQTVSASGGTQYIDYLILDKTAGSVKLSSSPATSVTINSTAGDVVQLNNTGGLDLNGQILTLNNNGGNIKLNGGARTISSTLANGTLAINGTKTVINGGSLTTDANTIIALAAGFDPGASLTTINGSLQINAGGFIATNSPTFGANARLIYNNGGNYSTALEWPSVNAPANVTIQASGTNVTSNTNKIISGDLTIGSAAILNVAAGKQLTVSTSMTNGGTLNLLSDNTNGTATILTPATVSGSGTNKVSQFLAGGRNWYISSPVSTANATAVLASSTATTKPDSFVWYDETKGSTTPWTPETSTLSVTKGYIVTNPTHPADPSTDGIITFSGGALNNGSITASLSRTTGQTKEGFNLIGNPYPSYVDLSAFTQTTDTTSLETSYWFRTKNAGGTAYVFDTYNLKTPGSSISLSGKPLTGVIAPMQAFWVRVKNGFTSGSLTFQNGKRRHIDNALNVMRAPAYKNMKQPILRLQVSNGVNIDETVLYIDPNASNGYDDYDSQKYSNSSASIPEIYTTVGNENMAINGMNSIPYNTEIPLGFTPGASVSFNIKVAELTNFDAGTQILLKDYATTEVRDITNGTPYPFTPDNSIAPANRFALIFKTASVTTGIYPAGSNETDNSGIFVSRNANNRITVNCVGGLTGESSVTVYNAVGQKLIANHLSHSVTVIDNQLEAGAYLVIVKNAGKSITKKVILN